MVREVILSRWPSAGQLVAASVTAFALLEATAAVWHLALFRGFYVAETAVMDRPFDEYIIPYLMAANALRAATWVALACLFYTKQEVTYRNARRLGLVVGLVCALTVGEYYGIWRFRSVAWPLVEGLWLVLQALSVSYGVTWVLRRSRTTRETPS